MLQNMSQVGTSCDKGTVLLSHFSYFCGLLYQVLEPDALLYQDEADDTLDQIDHLHTEEHRKYRHVRKTTDDKRRRSAYTPEEHTVKQERDQSLSACT